MRTIREIFDAKKSSASSIRGFAGFNTAEIKEIQDEALKHAIELLEAHANELQNQFDESASKAPSAYSMGRDSVDAGFKAQEFKQSAEFLRAKFGLKDEGVFAR